MPSKARITRLVEDALEAYERGHPLGAAIQHAVETAIAESGTPPAAQSEPVPAAQDGEREELAKWCNECVAWGHYVLPMTAEPYGARLGEAIPYFRRIATLLRSDSEDAERYRWLRKKVCVVGGPHLADEWANGGVFEFINLPDVLQVGPDSASALDAAIDKAREGTPRQACSPRPAWTCSRSGRSLVTRTGARRRATRT